MKKVEVQQVHAGETFSVFGDTFVALDHVDGGGVLAIRRNLWKRAPFDEDGKNNLRNASINYELSRYAGFLGRSGASEQYIKEAIVDLKATDGTREYGYILGKHVTLLTLEQYGRYQHLIPDVGWCWWLATPFRTPGEKCGVGAYSTWCVLPKGGATYSGCSDSYAIRPALVFAPSLLVKHEDSGKKLDGTEEEALYEKYIEYMYDWLNNWGEVCGVVGESPLSYDVWKEQEKADE